VAGLLAGLPKFCRRAVNRWCGFSIQAVQVAGGMILMGAGDAFMAGGTESMSRVRMMGFNVMPPPSRSQQEVLDFINGGLTAACRRTICLSRKDQEKFAYRSQAKGDEAAEGKANLRMRSPRSA
jgi:acetyl-CoA acyltransferase